MLQSKNIKTEFKKNMFNIGCIITCKCRISEDSKTALSGDLHFDYTEILKILNTFLKENHSRLVTK